MKLEKTTWNLALIWASFRMIADIIGKTTYGILELVAYLLQITMAAMIVGTTAAGIYWIWTIAGKPMPF